MCTLRLFISIGISSVFEYEGAIFKPHFGDKTDVRFLQLMYVRNVFEILMNRFVLHIGLYRNMIIITGNIRAIL